MNRIAVIGAVLENPKDNQKLFNDILSSYKSIIKGRMGIPFDAEDTAVIAITLHGSLDEINALTGKIGKIPGVTAKTAISNEISANIRKEK